VTSTLTPVVRTTNGRHRQETEISP
jgi:hypothetical protein